jgi:hypothetical protein
LWLIKHIKSYYIKPHVVFIECYQILVRTPLSCWMAGVSCLSLAMGQILLRTGSYCSCFSFLI